MSISLFPIDHIEQVAIDQSKDQLWSPVYLKNNRYKAKKINEQTNKKSTLSLSSINFQKCTEREIYNCIEKNIFIIRSWEMLIEDVTSRLFLFFRILQNIWF